MTSHNRYISRAWRPVQLELEGRLFFMHPDGTVYEKKAIPGQPAEGPLRRIKDQVLVHRVHQRFRDIQDAKAWKQTQVDQLVGRMGIKPKGEPPDEAA